MKTPALLTALPLCASAQKMQTPAGEAPGPWLLGTIGADQGDDAKTPKTTEVAERDSGGSPRIRTADGTASAAVPSPSLG